MSDFHRSSLKNGLATATELQMNRLKLKIIIKFKLRVALTVLLGIYIAVKCSYFNVLRIFDCNRVLLFFYIMVRTGLKNT